MLGTWNYMADVDLDTFFLVYQGGWLKFLKHFDKIGDLQIFLIFFPYYLKGFFFKLKILVILLSVRIPNVLNSESLFISLILQLVLT